MRRGILIAIVSVLTAFLMSCSAGPEIPGKVDRVMVVLADRVTVMGGQEAADVISLLRRASSIKKTVPDQPLLGTISLFVGDSLIPKATFVYDPAQNLLSDNKRVYELRSPVKGGTTVETNLNRISGDAGNTATALYYSDQPSQELLWGRDAKVLVLNPGRSAPFSYHLVGLSVDGDKWKVSVAKSWNLAGLKGLPDVSWRFFWQRDTGKLAMVFPKKADVEILELSDPGKGGLEPLPDLSEGLLLTTWQLDYPSEPFSAPLPFQVSIPEGATNVRFIYTPLREGATGTFTVDAVVEGGIARAMIPAKHASRIVLVQWEMTIDGKTLRSTYEDKPLGAFSLSD
ncbi:MAG TPA: hypothetical protein VGL40_15020 [Bacillota bacterium]|jgi:hypothetical protein